MCHPNGCFLRQGDVRPIWWTKGSHPRPIQHGWTFYGARFHPPHAFFNRVKMVLNNVVLINLLIRSIFISSSLALFCLFPGCCFNSDAALPTGNYTSANHPSRGQEGKLIDTVCFPYRWTYRFPHKTTNIVLVCFRATGNDNPKVWANSQEFREEQRIRINKRQSWKRHQRSTNKLRTVSSHPRSQGGNCGDPSLLSTSDKTCSQAAEAW